MLLRIHHLVITVHWLMNLISLFSLRSCGGASLFHGDWLVLLIRDLIEADLVKLLFELAHNRILNIFEVRGNVWACIFTEVLRFTLRSHVANLLCVLLIFLLLKIVLAFHGFKLISVLLFTSSYRSLTIIIELPRITSNLLRITLIISKPIISHWLICSLHRCIPSLPRDVQEWFGVL